MKLTVDGRVYDYDMDRMTNVEAMAIEKVTGSTFSEWAEMLGRGQMLAMSALVWVIQKREQPNLRFSEVEFEIGSVETDEEPATEDDGTGKGEAPDEAVTG